VAPTGTDLVQRLNDMVLDLIKENRRLKREVERLNARRPAAAVTKVKRGSRTVKRRVQRVPKKPVKSARRKTAPAAPKKRKTVAPRKRKTTGRR
jgi:hypothetical protein